MVQDGRFNVEISNDGMIARGTFVPAVGDGHSLAVEEVDYELRANGVAENVDWEIVKKSLETCNAEHKVLRDIVVAQGRHQRPEVPECLVFHPKIQGLDPFFLPPEKQATLKKDDEGNFVLPQSEDAAQIDENTTIDFRETHGLFIIHEGQVLAAHRQKIEGIPGQTVRGEYVPFGTLSLSPMEPGPNTETRDERVYAIKNGRFAWNAHSFWVEESLELEQVNYQTGNIRFPGSLVLKSGIKDGFKIWVGGNLESNGVIDAYEIFCGGNLDAHGGIIGRGKGLVRVRGALTARFTEHCDIEALGSVTIENTALNTLIYTLDFFRTSEKGKIVGGHVQARAGIEIFQVGNGTGVHTEVSVGENYVMHRKLDYARDKYQTILLAIQRLQERLKVSRDHSLVQQADRLQEEAQRYQTMMVQILSEINDMEDAALTVFGTIFTGVVVEICRVPLHISKDMTGVRFTLNKESGKVVVDSLAALKASREVKKTDESKESPHASTTKP